MRYFDKSGRQITKDEWRELYGNTRYSVLAKASTDKITIDTSWVGVATDRERVPLLFLTRTVDCDTSNKRYPKTVLADIWSPDAATAMDRHAERCKELGIKLVA